MTIASMHELFELVQDHYNTAYFPEDEITMFLNDSQRKIFNDLVFYGDSASEPKVSSGLQYVGKFEMDIQKQNILNNCILIDQDVAAVAGVVTRTAIDTVTGRTTALITSINDGAGDKIEIVRQSEYQDYLDNYFTNAEYTLGRYGNSGIVIDGATTETFSVSLIAEPREMDLTEPIQPDLIGIHTEIVGKALRIAGFAISDDELKAFMV